MKHVNNAALLPAGMSDVLSPDAAFESDILTRLINIFSVYGYEKVKPPLIEFEEGLLGGIGEAMESQTFRLMDPISQRMMGVRADMTPQIARISATRLKKIPRPLRLSYAGQVLRVKGSELRPERQFSQVGAELIGDGNLSADVEVMVMAANALLQIGVKNLSIDLGLPTLIPTICQELGTDKKFELRLRSILDRKDIAATYSLCNDLGEKHTKVFTKLMGAAGPVDKSLSLLKALEIGEKSDKEVKVLTNAASLIKKVAPGLRITLDPVENRGFEYHTGVTFTLFTKDVSGEIGAGGRYIAKYRDTIGEEATGFTLFMDTILRALPRAAQPKKIFLPFNTPLDVPSKLHSEGWITLAGLAKVANNFSEAQRLGCSHLFVSGKIKKI